MIPHNYLIVYKITVLTINEADLTDHVHEFPWIHQNTAIRLVPASVHPKIHIAWSNKT
jgi:hypothetical protein